MRPRMELLVLLFLHVVASALWASAAVVQGFFLVPAIFDAGPGGGAVMAGITKRKFVPFMLIVSWTALLTGLRLYSIRFSSAWVTTPEGIVLSLGTLLAISAAVIGMARQKPTAEKLAALASEIKGAPTPAQAQEMAALGLRLVKIARVTAYHLLAALVLMASHRLAAVL